MAVGALNSLEGLIGIVGGEVRGVQYVKVLAKSPYIEREPYGYIYSMI
jgi:hypothetical protein